MSKEIMSVYGRNTDGSSDLVGIAPITPAIKRRDIVANFFERPSDDPDDFSDANMCLYALEQYHEWLVSQGWTAPPLIIAQGNNECGACNTPNMCEEFGCPSSTVMDSRDELQEAVKVIQINVELIEAIASEKGGAA